MKIGFYWKCFVGSLWRSCFINCILNEFFKLSIRAELLNTENALSLFLRWIFCMNFLAIFFWRNFLSNIKTNFDEFWQIIWQFFGEHFDIFSDIFFDVFFDHFFDGFLYQIFKLSIRVELLSTENALPLFLSFRIGVPSILFISNPNQLWNCSTRPVCATVTLFWWFSELWSDL